MKFFRFTISFAALTLLANAAPAYKVTLTAPAVIGGNAVKAGSYRIVVDGEKATLTSGKTTIQVPVTVETGARKFPYTTVESRTQGGKNVLNDIQVGGTATTLVFKR
jgi:hypothetical protein